MSDLEYVKPDPDLVNALRKHIRDAHPNLLGHPDAWMAYRPLPDSGLSDVPPEWLYAIHQANHAGLYRPHLDDQLGPSMPERVRKLAEDAITHRLGHWQENAIISVDLDPNDLDLADDEGPAVILHVNSGGNATVCRTDLQYAGYRIEDTGYDPFAAGHYGVQLRIINRR